MQEKGESLIRQDRGCRARSGLLSRGFCSWAIMQDSTQQGIQKNTFVAWDGRDWITLELAPSDFHLFPALKAALSGRHFRTCSSNWLYACEELPSIAGHRFLPGWFLEIDFMAGTDDVPEDSLSFLHRLMLMPYQKTFSIVAIPEDFSSDVRVNTDVVTEDFSFRYRLVQMTCQKILYPFAWTDADTLPEDFFPSARAGSDVSQQDFPLSLQAVTNAVMGDFFSFFLYGLI
ncbi:hypothetical protein AVEN_38829-1 [Araneus ventricosus]|uniref:Uncharacterized protein n=1 Tax=Araneus ventricosus TaxID=182803 RepID=A0A4Y2K0I1_ARAVE|nr:hypothetical protein AVEN_38829-1 [Araneus ventricosus]